MNQLFLTFNGGELSPYLRHRLDFEKVPSGTEEMQNFLALPYGPAIKRPGLLYLAATEDAGANSRAIPFTASDGTDYLLHFTDGHLTIYGLDGTEKAQLDFLPAYTWPAPNDPAQNLRALQCVQLNDVAFIAHPAFHPMRVSRLADTSWTLEWLPFASPPVLDENLDPAGQFSVVANPMAAAWASGADYTAGDYARTGAEWLCIQSHHSGASTEPGAGASWRSYWQRRFFSAGDPVTLIATSAPAAVAWTHNYKAYHVGDQATYAICTLDHSDSIFEPGLPPDNIPWADITPWFTHTGAIPVGSFFTNASATIYVCIATHDKETPDAEPGYGVDWELFWAEWGTVADPMPAWYNSNPFTVGTIRSHNGSQFRCKVEHRPGEADSLFADAEPGIGSLWQTYWELILEFTPTTEASARGPGKYFTISPERDASDWQIECAGAGTSYSKIIAVQGAWNLFTYGTWDGTFYLSRSIDAGATWTIARQWESNSDRNVADSGMETVPALLQLSYSAQSAPASQTPPRAVLIPDLSFITAHLLLDEYVSATEMRGTALSPCVSGMTWRWARGAIDDTNGYPAAIALHDSRLWLAGTLANPVSLWASQLDDFLHFALGTATDADGGIFATLALSAASPIRWLASFRRLWVGTAREEWLVGNDATGAAVTPLSFVARPYSSFGSSHGQPVIAADMLVFTERSGARLRAISYNPLDQAYQTLDLSRLAEHLTAPGLAGIAWQSAREPGLWIVRRDGVLLHLTFSSQERVAAWSRHISASGWVRDVAVFPGSSGDDSVVFIVDRAAASCLERFPAGWLAAAEAHSGFFHVDGIRGTASSVTLPAHLVNTPVLRTLNGVTTTHTYTNASVTFGSATAYEIGLPVASRLVSLPVDLAAQDGATSARKKRASKITLSVIHSAGGQVWNLAESRAQRIPEVSAATSQVSGWFDIIPDAGHLDDMQLRLTHSARFPFILRAATMRWNLSEG